MMKNIFRIIPFLLALFSHAETNSIDWRYGRPGVRVVTNAPSVALFTGEIGRVDGRIDALAAGDHASLSNLTWTASGHNGTPARLAGFFEGGMAGYAGFGLGMYLDGDDNIAVSNDIISGAASGATAVQPADTNGWETGTHALLEPKLPDTPTNPATMYLDGNRVWSPIRIGAGGYAGNLYFRTDASTNAGYARLDYMAETTGSNLTATISSGEFLLRSYVFDSPLGTDTIDAGMWVASFYAAVGKMAGVSQLKFEAFVLETNGTETVLFSAYSYEINNDVPEFLKKETTQPSFAVSPLGRLGAKIYAKATVPSVTFTTVVGDGNGSFFTTPLRIRHTQLRDFDGDPLYQHVTATERTKLAVALITETDPEWTSKSNSYATVANLSSHTGTAVIHLSEAQAEKIAASITSAPPQTVVSVNDGTGAVVITAASLGALTNETDAIALAALAAHAAYWPPSATPASYFTFTTNSGAITITGYDIGGGTDVVIPDYINGLPVTAIISTAFAPVDAELPVTSVSGGNIMVIGESSFSYCYSLGNVSFPHVTTIGGDAFNRCTSLSSIVFSASAPYIGLLIFNNLPANQVTNYVTNPQATGWGSTFGGMPVVRLPLYADEIYQDGELVPSLAAIQGIVYSNAVSQMTLWTNAAGACTNMARLEGGTWITNAFGAGEPLPEGVVTNGYNSQILFTNNNDGMPAVYFNGTVPNWNERTSLKVPVKFFSEANTLNGYISSDIGFGRGYFGGNGGIGGRACINDLTHDASGAILRQTDGSDIVRNTIRVGGVSTIAGDFAVSGTVSAASAILRDSGQPVSWEFSVSNGLFYASTNGVRAYKLVAAEPDAPAYVPTIVGTTNQLPAVANRTNGVLYVEIP